MSDDEIQHSAHGIGTLIQKFNNQFSSVTRQKKNEWLMNFNSIVNNYTGTQINLNNSLFKVSGDSVDGGSKVARLGLERTTISNNSYTKVGIAGVQRNDFANATLDTANDTFGPMPAGHYMCTVFGNWFTVPVDTLTEVAVDGGFSGTLGMEGKTSSDGSSLYYSMTASNEMGTDDNLSVEVYQNSGASEDFSGNVFSIVKVA